jgi:cobalt-zinc-cadmium efflux system membrane fusion protein
MKIRAFVIVIGSFLLMLSRAGAQSSALPLLKISPSSEARRELVLATVKREPIQTEIYASATIEPDASGVAEVSSAIPARVVKLIAQPGERVTKGQPLVVLSSIELGQNKTDYLKARSLEGITAQHLKREQGLYEQKIASMKDLLDARAQYDSAMAQYEAARETLRFLISPEEIKALKWSDNGRPLSEFALVSPISGTLVKRDLIVGAMLDRNAPAPIVVMDLDHVWVVANVFEHDLNGIKVDDEATVTVDAYPESVFRGRITYVGDEVDRATRAVRARIEVPNPEHVLKPGMFARASIRGGGSRDVLVAPETSIYQVEGKQVVFIPRGADGFESRTVKLGKRGDGTVEILAGLQQGDLVVAEGGLALKSLITNKATN